MGLRDVWSFLTFQNLPAAKTDRANAAPLMLRGANAQLQTTATRNRPQWPRRDPAIFESEAYAKLSLIFRCVNVWASSLAEAPLLAYDKIDNQKQELPTHAFRQLMQQPNPEMDEAMFWYNVGVRTAIYGFCVVEEVRSAANRPVQLWPLNSEWLKAIPRDDSPHDWQYRVPGHPDVVIPAEDVTVFRFAERGNGDPYGIGGLEVALREWGLLNTMQDFVKSFFDGGGLPVYGLIPGDDVVMEQDEIELLREQWLSMTSWRNGAGMKPPFMQNIKGIERLSFDYSELAYIDLTDVSEIHICQAFGIPGSLVGQRFAQERNTFTNYPEARQSFYEDTISKIWRRFAGVMKRSVLTELEPRPTVTVEFDKSNVEALQEDQVAKRAHLLDAAKSGMVKRADYKRAAGLPVEPEDDVYMVPFNVVEVPAGKKQAQRSATVTVRNVEPLALTAASRATRGLVSLETRSAIETRANRVYTQAARSYGPKVQAFLDGQRDRVLAIINERSARWPIESRDAISELLSLDWGVEDDLLDTLIRQLWNLMGEMAVEEAASLLGLADDAIRWDIANPWVRQVLEFVGIRVTAINETTRQGIAQVVGDALNEGVTLQELSDRLEGLYDETYNGRSMTIARSESQMAYNLASVASFEESGVVSGAELLDNPKHDTDPGSDGLTCAERNGLIVELANVRQHIEAEHPNGSLAVAPVLATPLGEV